MIRRSTDHFQGQGDLPFAYAETWLARDGAGYLWRALLLYGASTPTP
jgi:hypothetical protein